MPANPKPVKGAYARRRKREKKVEAFARDFGNAEYVQAIHGERCAIACTNCGGSSWVGKRRCGYCVPGVTGLHLCEGRREAAHAVKKTRPDSRGWRDLLTLCTGAHGEQEGAEASFEKKYGVRLRTIADANVRKHGHLVTDAG